MRSTARAALTSADAPALLTSLAHFHFSFLGDAARTSLAHLVLYCLLHLSADPAFAPCLPASSPRVLTHTPLAEADELAGDGWPSSPTP